MNTATRETEFAELGLLTVVEAARLLRISRNLAYELVAQHQIPSVRLGRVIRVPRESLEAWIRQAAIESSLRRDHQNVILQGRR